MTRRREPRSAARIVDETIGEPLSWISGQPKTGSGNVRSGSGPISKVDRCLGEMLSWFGLGASRTNRRRKK